MKSKSDKSIITESTQETLNLGRKLGRNLKAGDVVCLFGQLGSGKTVLVKGIAVGLGIKGNKVNSPSFVLLKQYKGKILLNHFDLFRLKKIEEILDIGFQEYIYSKDISVIEWAERLGKFLPDEFLGIRLDIRGKGRRKLNFFASNSYYKQMLVTLRLT